MANSPQFDKLRFLLLQVRNPGDPMREAEVRSFARALGVQESQIGVVDLLSEVPSPTQWQSSDMMLFGGSGHYSAVENHPWLLRALDLIRELHNARKPTFASCWGFQAATRALGGTVVHDLERAEVGTHSLTATAAAREDVLFSILGEEFEGQMGHEYHALQLPPDAVRLASSERVENQAFCFPEHPFYCTQFHPELNRQDLMSRVKTYPEYVERISGQTLEEFAAMCHDTPVTESLLPRFVQTFLV